MKSFDFWGYQAEVDTEVTKCWYEDAEAWGCNCGHCQNFLALARQRRLPQPVLEALDALHIPPEKATYVCEMYPDREGHRYQFSYRVAGHFTGGREEAVPQSWGQGLCCHEPYPYGAPRFPQPHFDLEFWITLPWIQG